MGHARLSRCIVAAVAIACMGALCGPEARLGDECNTSIDCGLGLECTVIDVNEPDDTTCELVCSSLEDCTEVFGTNAGIVCIEPTTFSEVRPGQTGRCMSSDSL